MLHTRSWNLNESNGSVDFRHRLLQHASFGTCMAVPHKTNSSSNFHSSRAAAFAKLRFAEKDLPTVPATVGPGGTWRLENYQMKHHQHRLTCLVMLLWLHCLARMITPPMSKETMASQYGIPFHLMLAEGAAANQGQEAGRMLLHFAACRHALSFSNSFLNMSFRFI